MKFQELLYSFAAEGIIWALRDVSLVDVMLKAFAHPALKLDENGEIEAIGNRRLQQPQQGTAVAMIPIVGPISHKPNSWSALFGGSSAQEIGRNVAMAADDPNIESILMEIDSPGGSVFGLSEAADQIYNASKKKPVIAMANAQAGSAAFWLGSQASKFVLTPSGQVGSVGVVVAHTDISKQLENEGVKVSLITAGDHKGEGFPFEPLSEETREHIQSKVNAYNQDFIEAVARGRKKTTKFVSENFGQGRMFGRKQAIEVGMVDAIATLDDVLDELTGEQPKVRIAAEAEPVKIAAEVDAEPDLAVIETEINEKLKKLGYAV